MGPGVKEFRRNEIRRLRRKAHQLRGLSEKLRSLMPAEVRQVAGDVHVGFALYCMVLLGWPDLEYLAGLVFGFAITGRLAAPPFFQDRNATIQRP